MSVRLGDRFIRTNEDGSETLCEVYRDDDEAVEIDGCPNPLAGYVTVLAAALRRRTKVASCGSRCSTPTLSQTIGGPERSPLKGHPSRS